MNFKLLAAVAAISFASPVLAQTAVTTLSNTPLPPTNDGNTFTAPTVELRPQPIPTSSATITSSTALSANGSLELSGLRTRVYDNMSGLNIAANTIVSLTGDYLVTNGSPDGIQSPAFRVYVQGANGGQNELIWEAANNGGYTLGTADSVLAGDNFWRQIVGSGFDGTGGVGIGTYIFHTAAEWGDLLGGSVLGIGVGNGGCPGDCTNFHAYADNLNLTTDGGTSRAFDFQAAEVAGAVPEPATWGMMLLGFGVMGVSLRRRRRTHNLLQAA